MAYQNSFGAILMTPNDPSNEKTERILKAVRSILAQNGYGGTTIALVAKEAKVSRGLLHYYFKNKEEMLARVLRANMDLSVALIGKVFDQTQTAKTLSKHLTETLRHVIRQDPDFFNLFFEGVAVARQSPVVLEELESLYGRFRKALEKGLNGMATKGKINPSLPMEGLATLITGMLDGMGLQLVTEPELADDPVVWETLEQGLYRLLEESK